MFVQGKDKDIKTLIEFESTIESSIEQFQSVEIPSINEIIDYLSRVGELWHKDGKYYSDAKILIQSSSSFSSQMIEQTLDILPSLLCRKVLKDRIECELGSIEALDFPVSSKNLKREMFSPVGAVLHVTAGNVFLSVIDSLIMGLLTKNLSFIKLSSSNLEFPKLFIKSLLEVDSNHIVLNQIVFLTWKGGSDDIETLFKNKMDLIIAWGGEEMVNSYKKDLPIDTKLVEFGPKISFGILDSGYIDNHSDVYDGIARDVCMWDQSACANMQNLFVSADTDIKNLIENLSVAFDNFSLSRGRLTSDENVEVLKEISRAEYEQFETGHGFKAGEQYLIRFDSSPILSPSSLNRTLIIRKYSSIKELSSMLSKFKFYLQTCSLGLSSENAYALKTLAFSGITRFTKVGEMLSGVNGASHDGHYPMENFIRRVSIEFEASIQEFEDYDHAHLNNNDCVIFASGGTTGNPKFSKFKNKEFDHIASLLGDTFKAKGIGESSLVANLFVAGNMWSSFIVIYKALEFCEAGQLPIGGNSSSEDIIGYLEKFKPDTVFGIPSSMHELAASYEGDNIDFVNFFYAGENLPKATKELLEEKFNVQNFYSAGYASVDIGLIGYQDETCGAGEHILFDGIHLDIIDEEAVITSTLKSIDPVIRYHSGDRVERISEKKFKLLGRKNKLLSIWGARITVEQIVQAASIVGVENIQIHVYYGSSKTDILDIWSEEEINQDAFTKALLELCNDLRQTVSKEFIAKHLVFSTSTFLRNTRTGKTPLLLDKRA